MNLFRFSLKYPFFILAFWTAVLFFGVIALMKIPITPFPSSQEVSIIITTAFPGAGKDRVLEEVTKKLEEGISGIRGIKSFTSATDNEISEITIQFENEISFDEAESEIQLTLSQVKNTLPKAAAKPILREIIRQNRPLVRLAATSALPPQELNRLVKNSVRPLFEQVEGVSRVQLIGNSEPQATVLLDLEKMKEREISALSVVSQLEKIGKNAYLGNDTSLLISGEFTSAQEIGSVIIHYLANDKAIPLSSIATIREELHYPAGYTYLNGSPCLLIDIFERQDVDTLKLEAEFSKTLHTLQRDMSKELTLTVLGDSGAYLKYSFLHFEKTLVISVAVALFLIWAVFKDLRSILVSCVSVPTSLAATIIVLYLSGKTLNFLSLGALIISIGLVVDDMIIIRENIFRHLKRAKNPFEGTMEAMREISHPILGTSAAIIVGAAGFWMMQKTGILIYATEFALVIILTVALSLLEAFTLAPVLCAYCLSSHTETKPEPIQRRIGSFYKKLYKLAMAHQWVVIVGSLAILAGITVYSKIIQRRLTPSDIIGNIELKMQIDPKLGLDEAKQRMLLISETLKKTYPDIEQLGVLLQRGNQTTCNIQMVSESKRTLKPINLLRMLQEDADDLIKKNVIESYSASEGPSSVTGYAPDLELLLLSYDPQALLSYDQKLSERLKDFKGIFNLASTAESSSEETFFVWDFTEMKKLGILTEPAAKELSLLLCGYKTPPLYPLHRDTAHPSTLKVQADPALSTPRELLAKSFVPNVNSTLVPLQSMTENFYSCPSQTILRKNKQDLIRITADYSEGKHAYSSPINYTDKLMQTQLPPPSNIKSEWTGKAENQILLSDELFKANELSAIFCFLILIVLYEDLILPLVVLFTLPFSSSGSYIALTLTGYSMNIYSVVGTILAFAIAAKNGIIIICYVKQLLQRGFPIHHAVTLACRVRLRPILMTSAAVILSTIPIVIIWNDFSRLEVSLGYAILGGVVSSTILSLFIVPVFFKIAYSLSEKLRRIAARYLNTPP